MEYLREKRGELVKEAEALNGAAEAQKRAFTEDELTRLDAIHDELGQIERSLDATARVNEKRAVSNENVEAREIVAAPSTGSPRVEVTHRESAHHHAGSAYSWLMDLRSATKGDSQARERLIETQRSTLDQMPREKRDLYNASTAGQEFIPPLYMQDMYQAKHEAAAVVSGLVSNHAMPEVGRSITLPKQTGSVGVGITASATPLNALTETDATFGTATGTVYMISGVQDLELAIAERGTPAIDAVLAENFGALIGAFTDDMVINGSGSGQPTGLRNVSGIQSVTYTDASPTLVELLPKAADAQQQVETEHYLPLTQWVAHPRRVAKWATELDGSNRPLLGVAATAPVVVGESGNVAAGASGFSLLGVPVYKAAKIPTTLGASTNEDLLLGGDFKSAHLWLSPIVFEIDYSVNFKTGGACVRARRYIAFIGDARPDAIAKVSGTGFTAPTF